MNTLQQSLLDSLGSRPALPGIQAAAGSLGQGQGQAILQTLQAMLVRIDQAKAAIDQGQPDAISSVASTVAQNQQSITSLAGVLAQSVASRPVASVGQTRRVDQVSGSGAKQVAADMVRDAQAPQFAIEASRAAAVEQQKGQQAARAVQFGLGHVRNQRLFAGDGAVSNANPARFDVPGSGVAGHFDRPAERLVHQVAGSGSGSQGTPPGATGKVRSMPSDLFSAQSYQDAPRLGDVREKLNGTADKPPEKKDCLCDCFAEALKPLIDAVGRLADLQGGQLLPGKAPQDNQPGSGPQKASPSGWLANLQQVVSGMGQLATSLASLAAASTGLLGIFQNTGVAIRNFASQKMGSVKAFAGSIGKSASKAFRAFGKTGVGRYVRNVGASLKGVGQGAGKAFGGMVKAAGGAGKAAGGGILSALGGLAGAVTAPIAVFNQLTSSARGFVEALSPAAGLILNQALRDLGATIGVALLPVMKMVSGVVREFGSALLPIMQKLQPIVAQLSEAFGKVASAWIGMFSNLATQLIPAFKMVADMITATVPAFQAFYSGISGLVQGIAGLFGGLKVDSFVNGFKSAVEQLAKYSMLAAASLAKFIGQLTGSQFGDNFIKGMRNALAPPPDSRQDNRGIAAATSAQLGSLQSFGSTLITSTMLAGPEGPDLSKEDKWRDDVLSQLDLIAKGEENDLTKVVRDLEKKLDEKFQAVVEAIEDLNPFRPSKSTWETGSFR